jgi:hypothetical protein
MVATAQVPPVFVPTDELHAKRRQDGKIAMWAVRGGVATHETVVDVTTANPFADELLVALAEVAVLVGARA